MPFDPTKPAANSPNSSSEMRAQFTALKDLLDAQETRIAALEAALAGTALNPTVGTFSLLLSNLTTSDQVQAILDFTNSLSQSLTRV